MFVWFFHWEVLIICVLILLWYSSFFGISSVGGMGKLFHVNPNLLYDVALIYSVTLELMLINFKANLLCQTESCPFGCRSRGIFFVIVLRFIIWLLPVHWHNVKKEVLHWIGFSVSSCQTLFSLYNSVLLGGPVDLCCF